MAETPLTDSIEALTTYANQTTGASDTNLSDAVYTLAQGYGGGIEFNPALIKTVSFADMRFPQETVLDFNGANITDVSSMFSGTKGCTKLTIKNLTANGNANRFVYGVSAVIETLIFDGVTFEGVTLPTQIFGCPTLKYILGDPINLRNTTVDATLFESYYQSALVEVRFVPNTIAFNLGMGNSNTISDDSLISVANALVANAGKTITVKGATSYAKFATIVGNVVDGTFTKDATGTTTLSDFVTNVKGWSLAS